MTLPVACLLLTLAAPPQAAAETASQFYLRWRTTAINAKSIDEVRPFWSADMREQFDMQADSDKAALLPMMKQGYGAQTEVRVVKETPTPTGATLSLEGVDAEKHPLVGTVDVLKENGAWKVSNAVERWQPKRSAIPD